MRDESYPGEADEAARDEASCDTAPIYYERRNLVTSIEALRKPSPFFGSEDYGYNKAIDDCLSFLNGRL